MVLKAMKFVMRTIVSYFKLKYVIKYSLFDITLFISSYLDIFSHQMMINVELRKKIIQYYLTEIASTFFQLWKRNDERKIDFSKWCYCVF